MKISTRRVGQAAVVDVAGELDLHSSQELRKILMDVVRQADIPRVVVNLTGVTYIDSSGVSVLVEGLKASGSARGRYALCGLGPEVRDVLKLTQLLSVFEIHNTEEESLRGRT